MPMCLTYDRCIDVVKVAASALVERFTVAGPDAPVPTCPDWTTRDLIVHQGIVHRWAAGNLRRDSGAAELAEEVVLAAVADADLAAWSGEGAAELLAALAAAAPDVPAMVFLNDAPSPREFWARRQAHETTVHAVDALASALGRWPVAAETGVTTDLAVDGIDELLRGFYTRRREPADAAPFSVHVAPSDSTRRWTFRATPTGASVDEDPRADATFVGTAAQLYLGLWNRGDEIACTGEPTVLERWRASRHVTWS